MEKKDDPAAAAAGAIAEAQEIDAIVAKTKAAQAVYADYTQEQVDKIFKSAAYAACNLRIKLAQMAVEETGMGVVEDKIIKNHYASEYIYNKFSSLCQAKYQQATKKT